MKNDPALQVAKNLRTGLTADLAKLADEGKSIRVGIIGCGEMGTDLITAIAPMHGMDVIAVADRRLQGAPQAIRIAGYSEDKGVICENPQTMSNAIERGAIAITQNADDVISHPQIDVIIDATGRPVAGAQVGMKAMENGKHLVMMNVEADVTIGAYLRREAQKLGVVYTVGAGDEPSSTMELINFVTALGYPVVAAGKGKNNAFNIDATPDDYRKEAEARNMNPRMLVEFIDGSKTMVEMSCIANATGLLIDKPGMHGPDCSLEDLHKTLCPKADGGLLSARGRVDFSVGKGVAPGVFVIAEMSHPRIRERMNDLHLGEGPYYTFYRPYHLTSLEVPLSAARAVLYGTADMQPLDRPVAEVCARAKKSMKVGESLDAIGEYCYRSWAMDAGEARAENALPVGLLHEGKVIAPINKGDLITTKNTIPDRSTALYNLRCKQDKMLGYR
ncbi:MAG: Gfo/Idh/MocA family oxidoreductase [Devosiaceae bacterium]|nr:Gfo/Idh/MocA family oxidoreductase [Devosiaceae bacterium]